MKLIELMNTDRKISQINSICVPFWWEKMKNNSFSIIQFLKRFGIPTQTPLPQSINNPQSILSDSDLL